MKAAQQQALNKANNTDALSWSQQLVNQDLAAVNRMIIEKLHSDISLIPQLAQHLIAAGGKRIRPILTLLSARLCAYDGDRHIGLATSVEFIHTATLLHDDVVDASELRRGRNTANTLWGNKAPVLVGDFLFSRAFQLMVDSGNIRVLKILSDAAAIIAEGEVAQLLTANDLKTSKEEYFNVIRGKTAALFRAATQVGAVIAQRPDEEEEALAIYGEMLGIVFQLVDDALDYRADEGILGKSVGDDFHDGKVTLPVIVAYQEGDENEKSFWQRAIEQGELRTGDLEFAQMLFQKHQAIGKTLDAARISAAKARDALSVFPDSETKRCLEALVDFSIERAY